MVHRVGIFCLACVSLLVAIGCGGGGGGGRSFGGGGGGTDSATVSGTAIKGPVNAGTVRIFRLFDNGARGPELATGTTGSNGDFTIEVGDYRGPVVVCVSGGTYANELTGEPETIPADRPLYAVAEVVGDETPDVVVTPLTTISFFLASRLAAAPNTDMSQASRNADIAVGLYLGGVDVRIKPAALTDPNLLPGAAADSALAIGAISQIAIEAEIVETDFVHALGIDFADFVSDGMFRGTPIMDLNGDPIPALAAPADLAAAIATIIDGTVLDPDDTNLDDDLSGRSDANLSAPPRIVAVKGTVTTTEGGGFAGIRFLDEILPGNLQVFIESELVEVQIDELDEFGVDHLGFAAPEGLDAGAFDIRVRDTVTGQEALLRDQFQVVDEGAALTPGNLMPTEVSTAGGERVRLALMGALPTTRVEVDGVPAVVVNVVPGKYLEFTVPPGDGPGDVSVRNLGPAATLPNVLTRRDRGLGLTSTVRLDSGNSVVIGGLTQGFDGSTPFTRTFLTTVDPVNTDQGTFTREVREYRPNGQVTERIVTGDSFIQNQGESLALLNGSGADQLFHLVFGSRGGVMSGLHGGGQSVVMQPRTTTLTLRELAGEWPFAGTLQDLTRPEPRYGSILGSLAFDDEGNGGLSAVLTLIDALGDRETHLLSAPALATATGTEARIQLLEDIPFLSDSSFRVVLNEDNTLFMIRPVAAGTTAFSAFALRGGAGYPTEAEEGANVGGTISAEYREGVLNFAQDLVRRIAVVTATETQTFQFGEGTEATTANDPAGRFQENGQLSLSSYLGVDGRRYRGDDPTGIYDAETGFGVDSRRFGVLTPGVKLETVPTLTGDRRFVSFATSPTVEGFNRFETFAEATVVETEVRIPDGGTVVLGGLTKRTERSVDGGVPFFAELPLIGNLFAQRSATRHRNELLLFVTPTILNQQEMLTLYEESPRIAGDAPTEPLAVAARGAVSVDNRVAVLRDSGDSPDSRVHVLLDGVSGSIPISGTYHAGGVQYSFDGETGALTALGFRGQVELASASAGEATFDLITRREEESGSAVTGTLVGPGAWTLTPDGAVTLTFPGGTPVYSGAATADGELIVLVERTLAPRAGMVVLVRGSTNASPPIGSYSGMALDFEFTDTTVSPAEYAVSVGERVYTSGLGALNLSGIVRRKTTGGGPTALQQILQVSTFSADSSGGLTLTVAGEIRRGGLSANGKYGFALPGDAGIDRISIDLLIAE